MSLLNKYRKKDKNLEEEKEKIDQFLLDLEEDNDIRLKDADNRNIIFVGRTRAGKSTILRMMKDPTSIAKESSLYSETEEPTLYPFTVEAEQKHEILKVKRTSPLKNKNDVTGEENKDVLTPDQDFINYNMNIVDTPGLFEQKIDVKEIRNNSVIQKMILKCVEHEITKINVIFFVCSFVSGVQSDDIEAFNAFVELFKGAEQNIAMIITRAEKYTPERKKQLIEEICKHPKLSALKEKISDNIFFSGAPNETDYENGNSDSFIDDSLRVLEMRTSLYDFIFNCKTACHIKDLGYFLEQQKKFEQLQNTVMEQQDRLKDQKMEIEDKRHLELAYQQNLVELKDLKGFVDKRLGIRYKEILNNDKNLKKLNSNSSPENNNNNRKENSDSGSNNKRKNEKKKIALSPEKAVEQSESTTKDIDNSDNNSNDNNVDIIDS